MERPLEVGRDPALEGRSARMKKDEASIQPLVIFATVERGFARPPPGDRSIPDALRWTHCVEHVETCLDCELAAGNPYLYAGKPLTPWGSPAGRLQHGAASARLLSAGLLAAVAGLPRRKGLNHARRALPAAGRELGASSMFAATLCTVLRSLIDPPTVKRRELMLLTRERGDPASRAARAKRALVRVVRAQRAAGSREG
jgi:hypothetical protein